MTVSPHILAEQNTFYGRAKHLAAYLRKFPQPNVQVLQSLSRYLEGGDNWNLRFITRNGRPPKVTPSYVQEIFWGIGKENALSMALDRLSQSTADALSQSRNPGIEDLLIEPNIAATTEAQAILARLANVLDPDPLSKEKWKLVFRRPRRGNPKTELHTTISDIFFGTYALQLYEELKKWDDVDCRLTAEGRMQDDNSRRIRCVRLVRNSKRIASKPPE